MAVICCATPSELYLEETRSTLQFASRAKLVKTRAQVNEVLDDRSLIRRLQRELAQAKRQVAAGGGGVVQANHVKALENKAVAAGTAAREAEDRLKRLQQSILNSGVLFGDFQYDGESMLDSGRARKRRLSEGTLLLERSTPLKEFARTVSAASPKTIPRPAKQHRADVAQPLSPLSELSLLRHALKAKNQMVAAMTREVDDIMRLVKTKESEIVAAQCSNDMMRSDRDSNKDEATKLAFSLATLTSQLEAVSTQHKIALEEKDACVAAALEKLEQELKDREALEETIDALQSDKLLTEKQLDSANARVSDADKTNSDLQSRLSETEVDRERLSLQLEEEISKLSESRRRVDELEVTVEEMSDEHERTVNCWESSKSFLEEAQQEISKVKAELEEAQSQVVQKEKQIVEDAKRVKELLDANKNAENSLAQLEDLLKQVTAELSDHVKQKTSLEDQLEKKDKECHTSHEKLIAQEEAVRALTSTCEDLQASCSSQTTLIEEIEAAKDLAVCQLDVNEEKFRAKDAKIEQLAFSLSELESELLSRESELEASLSSKEDAEKKLGMSKDLVAGLKSNVKKLEKHLAEKEASLEALASKIQSTESDLSASLSSIQGLELQRDRSNLTIEDLEKRNKNLEDEISRSNEEHKSAMAAVESNLGCIKSELSVSLSSKNQLDEQLKQSKDYAKKLEVRVKELDDNNAKNTELHTATMLALRSELEGTQSRLVVLLASNRDLDDKLESARIVVENLESRIKDQSYEHAESLLEKAACLDSVKSQLKSAKAELLQSLASKKELEEHLRLLEMDAERGARRVQELEDEISRNTELEASSVNAMELELRSTQSELAASNASKHELEEQLEVSRRTVEEFKRRLGDMEATLTERAITHASSIAEIKSKLESTEADFSASEKKLELAKKDNSVVKSQIKQLSDVHSESTLALDVSLKSLQSKLQDTESDLVASRSSRHELEEQLEISRRKVEHLQKRVEELEKELSETLNFNQSSQSTIETKLNCVEAELSTSLSSREESEAKLAASKKLVADMERRVQDLEDHLSKSSETYSKEKEDLEERIRELGHELSKSAEAESLSLADVNDKLSVAESNTMAVRQEKASLECRIETLIASESQLVCSLEKQRSEKDGLVIELASSRASERSLTEELGALNLAKNAVEASLRETEAALNSRGNELITVHEMLEAANSRLGEMKQRVIDLEDELESKEAIFSQSQDIFEREHDKLKIEINKLREQVEVTTVVKESAPQHLLQSTAKNELSVRSGSVDALESENLELKKLLALSNASIEEARQAALSTSEELRLKDEELRRCLDQVSELESKTAAVSQSQVTTASLEVNQKLVNALAQKAQLEDSMAGIQANHTSALSGLKRLMGDEQREIIRQAETNMEALRKEISYLQNRLKQSEKDAYDARARKEDFEDRTKLAVRNSIQLKNEVASLENEVARLKRTISCQESNLDSEAASCALKDVKYRQMKEAFSTLKGELTKYKEECENNKKLLKELGESKKVVADLSRQLRVKDDRIAKLELVKLTREKMAQWKKINVGCAPLGYISCLLSLTDTLFVCSAL